MSEEESVYLRVRKEPFKTLVRVLVAIGPKSPREKIDKAIEMADKIRRR